MKNLSYIIVLIKLLFNLYQLKARNGKHRFMIRIFHLFICSIPLFTLSCSHLVYRPSKDIYMLPERIGFKKKDIQMTTSDGTLLTGWNIYPMSHSKNTVVLQLHGNGGNQTSHFLSLVWMVNYGYELVTYDYRGYGQSTGSPDRELIQKDTVEFITQIHKDCITQNKNLIIYGQSLGGAIALRVIPELKDKTNLVLLIVEGSFSSYRKVSRSKFKNIIFEPFPFLFSYLISNDYSPEEKIKMISPTPVIVIHELEDPIVPFENGKEVFKLLDDPKQLWEIRSSGHIQWMNMGRSPNALKFISLLDQYIQQNQEDLIH